MHAARPARAGTPLGPAVHRRAINAPLADGDADDLIFDNDSAGEIADVASFRVADGAIPQCQRALHLKHQKAPGELGHAAAHPGVAGSGEPLFAPTRALSSGEPVKPAVGAGDSMLAGIVLGLSRGLPLRDAVRFGMAAGAAALLGSGTQLCRRSDVERLYAGREYLLDA